MEYNFNEMNWEDGNKLYLFLYHSIRSGSQNDVSRRLLRFKNNEDISVEWFQQYSTQAIAQSELDFLDTAENWYVVAIPGSTANNEPCERICSHLAENFLGFTTSPMLYSESSLYRNQPQHTGKIDHAQVNKIMKELFGTQALSLTQPME